MRVQLTDKDNLLMQKNNKIQDLYDQCQENENEYKSQIQELMAENDELKNN